MGRIFIWAGKTEQQTRRIILNYRKTAQIQEIILLADRVVLELQAIGCEVFSVPRGLNLSAAIDWINFHCLPGDVALAIDTDLSRPNLWGTSIFYIANNIERKKHADLILLLLGERIPLLPNEGSRGDTAMGSLSFCRHIIVPSLTMKIDFADNSEDPDTRLYYHQEMALGIAEGTIAWSREVGGVEPYESASLPAAEVGCETVHIKIDERDYSEPGIFVNGNAYIPIDLFDRLGNVDISQSQCRILEHGGVVYTLAIELRESNISVAWDNVSRTLYLRSILCFDRDRIDFIMGRGNLLEEDLMNFLELNNPDWAIDFPELPQIYQQEGSIEGVNWDIAFSQMCLETDFLLFLDDIKYSENNFARLGGVGAKGQYASFPSHQIGIRAHIQHLKAYASREPLVQKLADPRFHLVTRGVAPAVSQLSRRWSADLSYGERIMGILRQLYESANLL
ncbi:MAG: glucosaminidase domain-containing protein [Prochloraceae cyanobacterium]|nr:glucosaminidase domain-containing protein [Prochloraceae cyanobacterium]